MGLPSKVTDDQVILVTYGHGLYVYPADKRDQAEEVCMVVEATGTDVVIGVMPAANWPRARQVIEDFVPPLEIHDMRDPK